MTIRIFVVALAICLGGCGALSTRSDVALARDGDSGGCLYAGELYSIGATKRTGKVVNDRGKVSVQDDPNGIPMTCVKDQAIPDGYRWEVHALSSR